MFWRACGGNGQVVIKPGQQPQATCLALLGAGCRAQAHQHDIAGKEIRRIRRLYKQYNWAGESIISQKASRVAIIPNIGNPHTGYIWQADGCLERAGCKIEQLPRNSHIVQQGAYGGLLPHGKLEIA